MGNGLRNRLEAVRGSLFYVPTLFVLGAIVLAQVTLQIDLELRERDIVFPSLVRATVQSARTVLGTVAAATITFAGVAFSISLLMIQLASSQFSPRVLHGFFRDPFSKRVMGVAVGTFTYSLLVLQAVRGPADEAGTGARVQAVIPTVSAFAALLFGIVAILAIIAFINHSAHSMEVNEIIRRITDDARAQVRKLCPNMAGETPPALIEGEIPRGEALVVRAPRDGWVQRIDGPRLLGVVDEGGMIRIEAGMGTFVTEGTPLVRLWPGPEDEASATKRATSAIVLGRGRTMSQDIGFGIRQIVDIGLRALSPGVNDPTTAYEAIVHLGPIMREILLRDLPPRVIADEHGRRLFRPSEFNHAEYVELAFDQIRRASTSMLSVVDALLVVLAMLMDEVDDAGLRERRDPLRRQAALAIAGVESSNALAEDAEAIRARAEKLGLL